MVCSCPSSIVVKLVTALARRNEIEIAITSAKEDWERYSAFPILIEVAIGRLRFVTFGSLQILTLIYFHISWQSPSEACICMILFNLGQVLPDIAQLRRQSWLLWNTSFTSIYSPPPEQVFADYSLRAENEMDKKVENRQKIRGAN